MGKYEAKTKATEVPVADYIAGLPDARRCEEAAALDELHRRITGLEPKMWGPTMIGYGEYDYTYDSGRSGTAARAGFSPRKAAAVVYLNGELGKQGDALFDRLGPHTVGKCCLYLKRLERNDMAALEDLIRLSWQANNQRWPR